jgi:hypothetical protein
MNVKIAMVVTVVGLMTLCLLVMKSSANHAFAATTCDFKNLKIEPGDGSISVGESQGQTISGTLTCGGEPLGDATITLSGGTLKHTDSTTTDSSGNYQFKILTSAGTTKGKTNYAGDSEHSPTSAAFTINLTEKNSGRFEPKSP